MKLPIAVILLLLVTACGKSGPLYLPDPPPDEESEASTDAPPEAPLDETLDESLDELPEDLREELPDLEDSATLES